MVTRNENEVWLLRSKISYLIGYTDIVPSWVERTPYREKLYELVRDLREEFDRLFPVEDAK